MTARVPLWIDLRAVPVQKRLPYLRAVAAAQAEVVLLGPDDPHLDRAGLTSLRIDGNHQLKDGTTRKGAWITIRAARDQDRAAKVDGLVIAHATDWKVIPLENLIAMRRDRPGTLFAVATSPQQALMWRDTLEHGPDGIVLQPGSAAAIEETDRVLRQRGPRPAPSPPAPSPAASSSPAPSPPSARAAPSTTRPAPAPADPRPDQVPAASRAPDQAAKAAAGPRRPSPFLHAARITRLDDAGPGDRVCIDTTSLFRDGEGLLVGSTGRSFCLVAAETLRNKYVTPRPFRVNAGAVHLYLFADGRTRYLSELRSGDKVLAVHADGVHRALTIGRCKVERRPHTLVAWQGADGPGSAVLQTAETVRLVRANGKTVAVTELRVGDEILVHSEDAARHFGMPVDESIEER